MGWGEWAARIGGYVAAPFTGGASIAIGEGIAQGLHNKGAVDKADATQQAATQQGLQQQQRALQTAGDVYGQQRADTQNLAGQSFQTLGGLMGMNIQPIGPPVGAMPSTASPTGMPTGLVAANQTRPLGVNDPWVGAPPGAPTPYRGPALDATTLGQLAAATPAARQQTSRSGYDPRRA